jgi:hypothetical protein
MESRFSVQFQRGLLGRPLCWSTPVKAQPTLSFRCNDVLFFKLTGHYVRINYSVLLNMPPVYHIVVVRVI